MPEKEATEVIDGLRSYGLTGGLVAMVAAIQADKKRWVDFMLRFDLGWGSRTQSGPGGLS